MIHFTLQRPGYIMLLWHHKLLHLIKISLYHSMVSYGGNKTSSLYKGKCELNLSMRSRTYATRARVCGMSTRCGVRLDKLAALNLMSFIPPAAMSMSLQAHAPLLHARETSTLWRNQSRFCAFRRPRARCRFNANKIHTQFILTEFCIILAEIRCKSA